MWFGLFAIVIAACSSSSDNDVGPTQPKPKECTTVKDCPKGTAACIDSFCVSQGCVDQDGDGAGVGPGCSVYDCDDSDAAVPGSEVCGNTKDDDCNNSVDEGCACPGGMNEGDTVDCGTGDCAGKQTCTGGKLGTCSGKQPAASETCGNAADENCDGQKDEGCCPAGEKPCPGFAVCSSNGVCE